MFEAGEEYLALKEINIPLPWIHSLQVRNIPPNLVGGSPSCVGEQAKRTGFQVKQ